MPASMPIESQFNEESSILEKEFSEQLNENLNPPQTGKQVSYSENIDINEEIKSKDNARLDFMNDDHVNSFVRQKTKVAEPVNESKIFPSSDEIKAGERKQDDKLKAEDLEMVSEFIINLVDTVIPHGLKMWSKDTSATAYSLPESKKKTLTKQLTYILIKNQTRFKIEIIFFIGLIMFYIPAVMKARETRKENKVIELQKKEEIRKEQENYVPRYSEDTEPAYIIKEDKNSGETVYHAPEIPPDLKTDFKPEKKKHHKMAFPKKRKPGGQSKS